MKCVQLCCRHSRLQAIEAQLGQATPTGKACLYCSLGLFSTAGRLMLRGCLWDDFPNLTGKEASLQHSHQPLWADSTKSVA